MIKFVKLRQYHLEQVMRWRTHPNVTRYMFTDIEENMDHQLSWYTKISNDNSQKHWLISYNDRLIGVVSLNDIQWEHSRCSWGLYIGEFDVKLIGGLIAPHMYQYVFETLKLKKITAEVLGKNEKARKTHLMHGCREVGVYKNHIFKYGEFDDVYLYELMDYEWQEKRNRYVHLKTEFEE
ncbi:UDP-4-amino-4,6-dideoxy-N-acetyl-beta-L-altrosamine N-acetyltransferase [Paenibacillus anaericanus]|uniref:UDP-4-amino-4, 6-dideoxy-N-acetyl-beta-L-altrosamine N-acetyltransferase n=1 Tax=Paenibacillus anaericanus TaxID=170367 RepID=A0A433Y4F5_9BACL|nr:UDP-4-amino-4,6-dideoxy-N-acetyl-beta-L-altrosamine N-acetyltransferase [Paenibacillus anaericanus]RUT42997.1 UDP-4-amino-4,6-dideoxy-N-acetyl-beta-L-altrosamine N-acetyltransferase [Paenibacillus anaericanus]